MDQGMYVLVRECVCISYFCSVISCIAIYLHLVIHRSVFVCQCVCACTYFSRPLALPIKLYGGSLVLPPPPPFPPDSHDHHDFGSCSNDPCIWVCIRTYITGVSRGECCHDNRQEAACHNGIVGATSHITTSLIPSPNFPYPNFRNIGTGCKAALLVV